MVYSLKIKYKKQKGIEIETKCNGSNECNVYNECNECNEWMKSARGESGNRCRSSVGQTSAGIIGRLNNPL